MVRKLLTMLSLLLFVTPVIAQAPAPVAKPTWTAKADVKPFTYPRGHKTNPNLPAIKKAAQLRNGHIRLPHVTASDWDSRTLGIIPPVKDQGQCGSCFTGDTMIRMADGTYRRIDRIKIGDEVISAEGNVCSVTHTMKRKVKENLIRIVISGGTKLEATAEHPILTENGYRKISELKRGDFVAIPRYLPSQRCFVYVDGSLQKPITNNDPFFPFGGTDNGKFVSVVPLTFDFGRLIGLYVAEGSASDRKVIWSLSIKEADTFAAEIVNLCQTELGEGATVDLIPEKGGCRVKINSANLSRQFLEWFGSGPENKVVPGCFMSANREFLEGMLSGWMDGDRQRGESAVTVSPILAMQMRDVANYLGHMPALSIHTEPKVDKRGICHLRSWRVALNNPETYKRGAAKQTKTTMWRKITEVVEGQFYEGYVYNLEVEKDHSYTANGIGVHNCWDFSGTGTVEVALIKSGVLKADGSDALSEQYTLDCGQNGGCNGDDNTTVLAWAKKTGLPRTADYGPYQASSGRCKSGSWKLYTIQDWGFADGGQGNGVTPTQQIKDAIAKYGCVGCAVAADGKWDSYSSGVLVGTDHGINHDVILVGWHDDPTISGGGYWIMRNSWGTGWGENGYARIAYGSFDLGTEAVWAVGNTPPAPPPGPAPVPPVPPGPSGTLAITSALTASGTVSTAFSYQITASGNPTSYGAAGLPVNLTLDQATGAISGQPDTAGTFNVTISAANNSGTVTATLVLTVASQPSPSGNVSITLTPAQVASVLTQSGVNENMTIKQFMEMCAKCKTGDPIPVQAPKTCCGNQPLKNPDLDEVKETIADLKKGMSVIIKKMLKDSKEPAKK